MRVYTETCNMAFGKEPKTYDLSLAILHEEVELEVWFQELLDGRPSGHFRRRVAGEGAYAQEFPYIK